MTAILYQLSFGLIKKILLALFLIIYAGYAYWIINYLNGLFRRNYLLQNPDMRAFAKCPPTARYDFINWSKTK